MKLKVVCVSLILAASSARAAWAQEELIAEDVVSSIREWATCQVNFIQGKIKANISAEILADQSIDACSQNEAATLSLIRKHYGNSQDQSFQKLKSDYRNQAIEAINADRSGTSVKDPTLAWSECIGQHAKNGIRSSKTNDQVVDEAFEECKSFEAGVTQNLSRSLSTSQAETQLGQARKVMRAQLLIMVSDARKK